MKCMTRYIALVLCCLTTAVLQAADTQHVRLTNLPHVYINTFTGNSITSKTTYVYARMWMVDEEDIVTFYDSLEIRGRGNSTWNRAKRPYKLKFHQKEKLLGKGYAKTKKWTLLANHGDKTLMRNALTSAVGERLGLKFNPAAKFVDLTLNGTYVGTYQISDAIDVRPHRVNIMEQDYPLTEESNITGGYLLEADGFYDFTNGVTGFYTSRKNVPLRIHYPDEDEIDNRQYRYIRDFINAFERLLYSSSFKDKDKGYRPMVDSLSLANWYLATEVSGNIDGFFSTYFYKDADDDRLYWGPLWDYDIAYANDDRKGDTSRQLMRDVGYGSEGMRQWVVRFWEDPWFRQLIGRRWVQAVEDGLEEFMLAKVDSLATLLDASQQLNFQRWGINQKVLRERVLYSTYGEYVGDLRKYVSRHLAYLTEVLSEYVPKEPEPKIPDFDADTLVYYAIANVGSGTVMDLNSTNDEVCANRSNTASESQQWRIWPLSNGYMFIENRMTGRVLCDPTEGNPTATTLVGTRLVTADPDSTDIRQQWDLVSQGNDRFNLINRFSEHGANLSGGGTADGTPILSYTSDNRNGASNNRLWRIEAVDEVPNGIEDIQWATPKGPLDYALAYAPSGDRLHFGSDDPSQLTFSVRLYDRSGRLLRTFRASDGCSLSGLPRGLYIVSWQVDGHQRSVKFVK